MADIIAELITTSEVFQMPFWIKRGKSVPQSIPDGLGVRIPGFHPGGPGSIPGLGEFFSTKMAIFGQKWLFMGFIIVLEIPSSQMLLLYDKIEVYFN